MSYDLTLSEASDEVSQGVAKLAQRFGCEHYAADDAVTIGLQVDDEQVVKLYRALVKLAKESSTRLHDPQQGADVDLDSPGRFPPMWAPTTPVFGRSFKAKVKSFLLDHLRPHGFTVRDPWTAVRDGEKLTQGVNFQPGTGHLSGRFNVNIYWTFTFRPLAHPSQMTVVTRFDEIARREGKLKADAPHRGWLAAKPAKSLERSFKLVQDLFGSVVLPQLDAVRRIEGLVTAFEAGDLDLPHAFSMEPKEMADCYGHLGRQPEGLKRYEAWLDRFEASEDRHAAEWARAQRERARRAFRYGS